MVVKQKTHIKHLFAYKPNKKHGDVDIAILTDSNQYIEYTLVFKQMHLTKYTSRRIRSLFEPYFIDKHTDIVVNDLLNEDYPLYQYFMNLRQHIGFKLTAVAFDKVINRVHYFYFKHKPSKPRLMVAWNRAIESKQCPWITQEVEYALQNKGPSTADRMRRVRLAMLYIVIKNYLYRAVKKSKMAKSTCV